MIDSLIAFFDSIFSVIELLIDGVAYLLRVLPDYQLVMKFGIGFAPTFLSGFLLLALAITVLYGVIRLL